MYILGISAFQHDSSACLLRDGKLLSAVEEERFSRHKHDGRFPYGAINYCLEEAGITINDIDHVAFFWNPWLNAHRRIFHFITHLPKSINYLKGQTGIYVGAWFGMIRAGTYLKKISGYDKNKAKFKFHYVEHHIAHAASAFFLSPFKEAAILSVDGLGEWASTLLADGEGSRIKKIKEVYFPNSLGAFYTTITTYLNFKRNCDEYKVMGLAAYGKPVYYDKFKKILIPGDDGSFRIDKSYFDYVYGKDPYFSKKFIDVFGPPRKGTEKINQRHMDIAASAQKILEDIIVGLADFLYKNTGHTNICVAGGVGLNGLANTEILKKTPFKNIYIQPAAYDAGAALGAAYYVYNGLLRNSRNFTMTDVYYGPCYSDDEIEKELKACKLKYEKHENIARKGAELLTKGKIIGWFQGRMEFGPRALGARSIIADPRNPDMKDIINICVKHREEFRPFAPAILAEHCGEFYDMDRPSPFMLLVYDTRSDKRNTIPAVTHVDGSGRVQTVDKSGSSPYRALIEEFYKITGVPVILNTSFNIMGEPIVTNPEQAIRCFYTTGIDCLILGSFLIEK